ncbi:MAG: WYL domain-containing protein [Desulfobacter sp.]|nr:MAG: WYL domain-containing protein [Desulfobacter sp.]
MELRISRRLKPAMEEHFGPSALAREEGGTGPSRGGPFWRLSATLPLNDWLYGFLLSLGPEAELISPSSLKTELAEKIKKMKKIYSNLT